MSAKLKPISELKGVTACCCQICGFVSGTDCLRCNCMDQCLWCQVNSGCACVKPNTCCLGISNCCCIDSRQAFPPTKEVPLSCAVCGIFLCGKKAEPVGFDGKPLSTKLRFTWATCCCQSSLGGQPFPECCGCSGKGQFCCCENTGGCVMVKKFTCCKGQNQCCCCDGRSAMPPDKDVPFAIAVCGKYCVGKPPVTESMDRDNAQVAPAKPGVGV